MPRQRTSLAERFASKVASQVDANGCLLWLAGVDAAGYGRINTGGDGVPMRASRAAWLIARGPIPAGHVVMHVCDTPRCVNVEHLKLGTRGENIKDMLAKGRSSKGKRFEKRAGAAHGMAKLTWAQVCDIRERHAASGESHANIAVDFGVSRSTVTTILSGKHWTTPGEPA